ncbi:DUF6431 domain-containing protein [Alicyclobacillus acidoterrestris]|uniref:DUF6431 domain-containing protein n=1 Tax=Alicyclobacillus acidoterrestris TaxID=1450 RepID=UPI0038990303
MSSPPEFFVRSEECIPCPCCQGQLVVCGSRRRRYTQSNGDQLTLIIRRLRCTECHRIHHELPDILVPYKRYDRESIEQIITESSPSVGADESTIRRVRQWFETWSSYATGCLVAIANRHGRVLEPSYPTQSSLHRIGHLVGDAVGWMARAVRPIANLHLWTHTRSACVSASSLSTIQANPT